MRYKNCFQSEEEAYQFAKDLRNAGYEVEITQESGLTCVHYGFSGPDQITISDDEIQAFRQKYADY